MTKKNTFSRRRFLKTAAAATALPGLLSTTVWAKPDLKPVPEELLEKIKAAIPDEATAKPAKPRKILIFCRCEGFPHASIAPCNEAIKMMGERTGAFDSVVSQDMAAFDPGKLDEFDAVLFNNTTRLKFEDPKRREALMSFVKGGKGIIGIHAATDNFYNWPEAAEMMGGVFDGHPWGGGGTWAFQIEEPDHPINKGFAGKGFLAKEEVYKIRAPYTRERSRILVGLDMTNKRNKKGRPDNDNAVSWIHPFGDGRVFYCSLGHNNEIFCTPEIMQHYLDGIQYALGDLKADDTPSAKLGKKVEVVPCPENPEE